MIPELVLILATAPRYRVLHIQTENTQIGFALREMPWGFWRKWSAYVCGYVILKAVIRKRHRKKAWHHVRERKDCKLYGRRRFTTCRRFLIKAGRATAPAERRYIIEYWLAHNRCALLAFFVCIMLMNREIFRKTATFFALQSTLRAPQSIDKQRKTSNRNGLLVFSVLENDSNFDRNPLRGCNYGLEGGAFLILVGCSSLPKEEERLHEIMC